MDMKKFLALILFFTSTGHLAYASGWSSVGNSTYMNSKSILTYYNERHEIVQNQYSFWTRHFNDGSEYFKIKEKEYNIKISMIHTRYVIDCYNKTIANKTELIYDEKSRVVKRVNRETDILEFIIIKENTPANLFYKNICAYTK